MASDASINKDQRPWLYKPTFPAHWKRQSLYSAAEWVNGLAFRNIQFSLRGKPVIKIAEIKNGLSSQTKFTEQTFGDSVRLNYGDLLFSWSGQPETSIDAFWWRGEDGWLNQHIFKVTPKKEIDVVFFYYLLKYLKPNFVAIAKNKQTTGLGHVTKRDLENIEVGCPSLSQQKAIAHILGTLDDKIELNRRMNETLEGMARAMFKAWFVDFEPVRAKMEGRWRRGESLAGLPAELYDAFPERLVDSELGEIPEGWRVSTIGDEVVVCGGATPSTKEARFWEGGIHCWATPKDLSSLASPVLLGTERRITDAGLAKISSGLLPVGSVLLSSRAPIGYLAVAEVPTAINQGFIAMICERVLPSVFVLFWCRESMDSIVGNANGSTFQEISKKNFRPISVVVPPESVLSAFCAMANSCYRRVAENERNSQTLAAFRDVLLPKLISGELRVKDAEDLVGRAL